MHPLCMYCHFCQCAYSVRTVISAYTHLCDQSVWPAVWPVCATCVAFQLATHLSFGRTQWRYLPCWVRSCKIADLPICAWVLWRRSVYLLGEHTTSLCLSYSHALCAAHSWCPGGYASLAWVTPFPLAAELFVPNVLLFLCPRSHDCWSGTFPMLPVVFIPGYCCFPYKLILLQEFIFSLPVCYFASSWAVYTSAGLFLPWSYTNCWGGYFYSVQIVVRMWEVRISFLFFDNTLVRAMPLLFPLLLVPYVVMLWVNDLTLAGVMTFLGPL